MKRSKIIVLIILAAIVIAALVFFEVRFQPIALVYYTLGWGLLVLLLLWAGNRFITKLLNRFLSWSRYGNIRFFIHLLLGIVFSLFVVNGSYAILKFLLTNDPPTRGQLIVMNFMAPFFLCRSFPFISVCISCAVGVNRKLNPKDFRKKACAHSLNL